MSRTKVLIFGAAGRDFHNFNTVFRSDDRYEVVGFTAAQIPDIAGRRYPAKLAGPHYPAGIPIFDEADAASLIAEHGVQQAVFAYSDVSHLQVMHLASVALAAGADFRLIGPDASMLGARKPVVSVSAVRTGSGKSQTTRAVCRVLQKAGLRLVVVRHPMPYGDLVAQEAQRFATVDDLSAQRCTIEEREEFEPHLTAGTVVFAGVDYEMILRRAEEEADIIVWDGGNNDFPFFRSDCEIVVVDPHRPGHETTYHPGETNLRRAGVLVINKIDTAAPESVAALRRSIRAVNPKALVIDGASPIYVDDYAAIAGKRVLVVEDGPTLTHGDMAYGAGIVAAQRFGAAEIVDPRPYAVGTIAEAYRKYPQVGALLPAMGYSDQQRLELETTIRNTPCDLVLIATPIDLRRVISLDIPALRVRYELQEIGAPTLEDALAGVIEKARAQTAITA